MFTGIIEATGRLDNSVPDAHGRKLRIAAPFASRLAPGQSIAVNGACLTIAAADSTHFEAVVIPETQRKTTLGDLQPGTLLNLERAIAMGAHLDGHLLQGHIDTQCPITAVRDSGGERLYDLEVPAPFGAYIIQTGSIAIDGISLTIAQLHGLSLTVAIVPFTYQNTNVHTWHVGTRCNVEFDLMAKYAARHSTLSTST